MLTCEQQQDMDGKNSSNHPQNLNETNNSMKKRQLLRQRSNAFNNMSSNAINQSMTSVHSYFYQADVTAEITDSFLEQQAVADSQASPNVMEEVNSSAVRLAEDGASHDRSKLKLSPKDSRMTAS